MPEAAGVGCDKGTHTGEVGQVATVFCPQVHSLDWRRFVAFSSGKRGAETGLPAPIILYSPFQVERESKGKNFQVVKYIHHRDAMRQQQC